MFGHPGYRDTVPASFGHRRTRIHALSVYLHEQFLNRQFMVLFGGVQVVSQVVLVEKVVQLVLIRLPLKQIFLHAEHEDKVALVQLALMHPHRYSLKTLLVGQIEGNEGDRYILEECLFGVIIIGAEVGAAVPQLDLVAVVLVLGAAVAEGGFELGCYFEDAHLHGLGALGVGVELLFAHALDEGGLAGAGVSDDCDFEFDGRREVGLLLAIDAGVPDARLHAGAGTC